MFTELWLNPNLYKVRSESLTKTLFVGTSFAPGLSSEGACEPPEHPRNRLNMRCEMTWKPGIVTSRLDLGLFQIRDRIRDEFCPTRRPRLGAEKRHVEISALCGCPSCPVGWPVGIRLTLEHHSPWGVLCWFEGWGAEKIYISSYNRCSLKVIPLRILSNQE